MNRYDPNSMGPNFIGPICVTSRRRTAVDHSEIGPSLLETERHRLCRGKRFICRGAMDEAGGVRESNSR